MDWDALICTSNAARTFVTRLHDDVRQYWRESTGASRFNDVQLPVIPLVAIDQFTVVNRRVHNHSVLADGVYSGFADVWVSAR